MSYWVIARDYRCCADDDDPPLISVYTFGGIDAALDHVLVSECRGYRCELVRGERVGVEMCVRVVGEDGDGDD